MCCGRWRRLLFAVALVVAAVAGSRAIAAAAVSATRLQFVFFAVLVPVARRRGHQMDRRARPAVCRRQGQRLQLRALSPEPKPMPAFRPAHAITRFRAGLRGVRGLAAGTDRDDRVCGADRGQPSGAAGPSSQRRGCGRVDRRGRRDVRAVLVRRPPARVRHSAPTAQLCRLPDLAGAPQKGCPRARQPHKKRTPQTPDAWSGCRPTQTMSVDLPSSDQPRWPFPSSSPCATKPRT